MECADEHIAYCAGLVERDDHDRYLTVLHARAADRPALFALYAFNLEIAKTRETVTEPALGEIRLQWWRETIEGIYAGACREHPVARGLDALRKATDLTEASLQALINGREADLYDEQPETLAELEAYAAGTGGAVQALAAMFLGGDATAQRAAGQVGTAWALAGLMRALPLHLAQGRVFMPRALMREEGLTDPSRPDREQSEALARILYRVALRARELIAEARSASVLPRVAPVLRLAPLAEGYLACLARAGYVPDRVNYERGALGRQCRLAWAGLRRTF